ncbi:MAG: S26 family signal peptidase [Chitinispirillaceae bacterium]
MDTLRSPEKPIDARISVYKFLRLLVIVGLTGGLVKLVFFETSLVSTNQMHPGLYKGDRLLVSKTGTINPFSGTKSLRKGKVAILSLPIESGGGTAAFRIAATPNDTFEVIEGNVRINGTEEIRPAGRKRKSNPLPAQYSPRDAISPFAIPGRGDSVSFADAPLRDLVFHASMIRQENERNEYILQTRLLVDSADSSDYFIEGFSLYDGTFSSIPDSLRYDWFFWDRLIDYFDTFQEDHRRIEIRFDITRNGETVSGYRYQTDFFFLLADNWEVGYDSRFFGPISRKNIHGTAECILWSRAPSKGLKGFRTKRFFKIVR